MKKVLVLYNKLFHYRIPVFALLSKYVDLTVVYSLGDKDSDCLGFKVIKVDVYKFGRFVLHKENILSFCNNFDVVIVYGDISWMSYSFLALIRRRKFKLIFWSPGVSASYDKKFDEITYWDSVRDFFYRNADALIFYSEYPIRKYVNRGYDESKLFVAHNTVEVIKSDFVEEHGREYILFVGTLYKQKGIYDLLENYLCAYKVEPNIFDLCIVGAGDEYLHVVNWVNRNELGNKIYFKGAVYDPTEKMKIFNKALACISPRQAGLTVLESMGYGVPFVTMSDSITGGERLNIRSGFNGILIDDVGGFKDVILRLNYDKKKFCKMGKNAYDYYYSCRTVEQMVAGILDAIEFVAR